ncbi:hypothetical protein B0J18DRAFT_131273 [Chaetomium sp. MPI-SDFR-AT-0129]|nr:hypothetical protein B0J18DRAFT_131273 [Chaetomium sp. MPI-SDFR-AT-0129]
MKFHAGSVVAAPSLTLLLHYQEVHRLLTAEFPNASASFSVGGDRVGCSMVRVKARVKGVCDFGLLAGSCWSALAPETSGPDPGMHRDDDLMGLFFAVGGFACRNEARRKSRSRQQDRQQTVAVSIVHRRGPSVGPGGSGKGKEMQRRACLLEQSELSATLDPFLGKVLEKRKISCYGVLLRSTP